MSDFDESSEQSAVKEKSIEEIAPPLKSLQKKWKKIATPKESD